MSDFIPWWEAPTDPDGDPSFFVVDVKLHDPSAWKCQVLERCSILVSNATAAMLERIQASLALTYDATEPDWLLSADLTFSVDADKAKNIQKLLAQVKTDKQGNLQPFTNAYRFIACVEDKTTQGRFLVTARLARGVIETKVKGGVSIRTHKLDLIPATTGLQQLLGTYMATGLLRSVPRHLRAGICQEVAQQVTSYLGQIGSSKVKGDVLFPTVEDRDPARRKAAYGAALDWFLTDANPLTYAKARDLDPGAYAPTDPKGDRMLVNDPRWEAVMLSPEPHPIPLLYTSGDAVTVLEGDAVFDAGVAKADRHRGALTPNPGVLADRPKQVQCKGKTHARPWYVALPILESDDAELRAALAARAPKSGRGLDFHFKPMPIMGKDAKWKPSANELLVPIEGNRDRVEAVLRRKDLEIAWTRLLKKGADWHLQFTVRHRTAEVPPRERIMGVAFDLNAIATWVVLDDTHAIVAQGQLAPNPQILAFLQEKSGLEWDQGKGRWVGGHSFAKRLESVAHGVANDLLAVAQAQNATLCVEDIAYVPKQSANASANVLFSAWNYGQLRKFLEYKAAPARLGEVFFASDYLSNLTCPSCGAIRGPKEDAAKAKTYRDPATGELHCRKCGFRAVLTPVQRATRVARHAFDVLVQRAKRAAAP